MWCHPRGSPVITHSSHKMASLSWSSTFLPAPVPHSPVSVPNLSSHSHLYRPMFCLLSHSDLHPQSTLHYCWSLYIIQLRMFLGDWIVCSWCCSLYFILWVLMSDSSSQLTKDASSSSQDAARPTELWVCRACTESPVGAGAEARTDHHKDILSIVNTDWGLYAGCDPGKCVSLPPST